MYDLRHLAAMADAEGQLELEWLAIPLNLTCDVLIDPGARLHTCSSLVNYCAAALPVELRLNGLQDASQLVPHARQGIGWTLTELLFSAPA